jgi:tripartite-type tricarboxylate transporter receptor subunit TctC
MSIRAVAICAILLSPFILAAGAAAQSYPTRPIRLVIPYPPGGVVDAVGRPWADRMKSLLGTVVVENIGGGGGEIGAATVSRAPPDGYTILLANSSIMVINPLAASHVSYDPVGSFDAVSIIGHGTQAIAINPTLPVRTLKELVDYAKRNPGKLSYGTPGVGSLNHLTGERFKLLIGSTDIVHVPYRGAGPAIADLIGGQIPMAIPAVNGQLLAFHRAGTLRILAVTSPERLQGAPDLPTVSEAGMPELTNQATIWLLVPKGTPREIFDQISSATRKALAEPELRQIYLASGIEPSSDSSPEAATQSLQDEIVLWKPVVKQIGLKLD